MTERYLEESDKEIGINKPTSIQDNPHQESLVDSLSDLRTEEESVQNEADRLAEEIKNFPIVPKFETPDDVLKAYLGESKTEESKPNNDRLINQDNIVGRTLRKAVAIGTAFTSLFGIGGGQVLANAEEKVPVNNDTEIEVDGTMPSQEVGSGSGSVEITPAPPEGSEWYLMTSEQQEALKKQINESLMSPTPTPLPEVSTKTVWDIINESENTELQQYRDEAKAYGIEEPAWNESCAKTLRAYDNSPDIPAQDGVPKTKGENRWQTNITREEILEAYLKKDKKKFVFDVDGGPGIFIVQNKNVDKNNRVGKAFKEGIELYQKDAVPNIVEILKANGMNFFCPVVFDERGPLTATFDRYGGFYLNLTKNELKNTPDKVLKNIISRDSYIESIGISYLKVCNALNMDNNLFLIESVKGILASEACAPLSGIDWYRKIGDFYLREAASEAEDFDFNLTDTNIVSTVRFMKINNLARSLTSDGWKVEIATN